VADDFFLGAFAGSLQVNLFIRPGSEIKHHKRHAQIIISVKIKPRPSSLMKCLGKKLHTNKKAFDWSGMKIFQQIENEERPSEINSIGIYFQTGVLQL